MVTSPPIPVSAGNIKASSAKQRVSCLGEILQVTSEEKILAQNVSKTDAKRKNKGNKKFRWVNQTASRKVYTIKKFNNLLVKVSTFIIQKAMKSLCRFT